MCYYLNVHFQGQRVKDCDDLLLLLRERDHWEDNIKMGLQEWDVRAWTRSSWLRIGTGWGHL